jgi:hypothetical protein
VHVEWDPEAPLTPIGQASFFIEFLKASGVFDALVADCPLDYTSPNAPNKRDVLGTAVLSMLSGHKRYAHMAALRADGVLPELLGLRRVMSEDAVRRGLKAIPEVQGIPWLSGHLDYCTAPLLGEDSMPTRRSSRSTDTRRELNSATIRRSLAARATSITATCWRMCGSSSTSR